MRIVFVRHGDPDYEHDCITPKGKLQAEAVSKRLLKENICEIYSSTCGRALQTAKYTSDKLGLEIKELDWMREIGWGGKDLVLDGHPWTLSDRLIDQDDFDFLKNDWREHPYFKGNQAVEYYDDISKNFDELLKAHGYIHQGRRFLCSKKNEKTIAVFSHGGSAACVFSHLLSIPWAYFLSVFLYNVTSVSVLNFPSEEGKFVHPRMELFNDCGHLDGLLDGMIVQQKRDGE